MVKLLPSAARVSRRPQWRSIPGAQAKAVAPELRPDFVYFERVPVRDCTGHSHPLSKIFDNCTMNKPNGSGAKRSSERRDVMLATAWQVFLEVGYEGASMAEICARLGGSKATLYSYFESKEALFLAVIQEQGSRLYGAVSYPPKQTGDLRQDLTEFGHRLLEAVLSDEYVAFLRLVIAEAARFPLVDSAEYGRRRATVLQPLTQRLDAEMEAGVLRRTDALAAAEVLWTLCINTIQRRLLITTSPVVSREEAHQTVSRAVEIFMAAYAA